MAEVKKRGLVRLGFVGVAALQVLLLTAMVGPKEWTLVAGRTVTLQTVPVDPRDLFRGDYVVLRYRISTPSLIGFGPGETVYVALAEQGDTWEPAFVSRTKPEGVFIKGKTSAGASSIEFGIEAYYVPEGSGHLIERARDVKVRVAINGSGRAAIKQVLVDGRPFDPSPGP